jgi:hypothetical protein
MGPYFLFHGILPFRDGLFGRNIFGQVFFERPNYGKANLPLENQSQGIVAAPF